MTEEDDTEDLEKVMFVMEQVEKVVRAYGHSVVGVVNGGFSYTVGREQEIIIFGLAPEQAQLILNHVSNKNLVDGDFLSDVVQKYHVAIRKVRPDEAPKYALAAYAYAAMHGLPEPEVMAVVWPDQDGKFPWQAGFDPKFAHIQPDVWTRRETH